jgi:hypothetical protein
MTRSSSLEASPKLVARIHDDKLRPRRKQEEAEVTGSRTTRQTLARRAAAVDAVLVAVLHAIGARRLGAHAEHPQARRRAYTLLAIVWLEASQGWHAWRAIRATTIDVGFEAVSLVVRARRRGAEAVRANATEAIMIVDALLTGVARPAVWSTTVDI